MINTRIPGYDLARAIAIFGMMIINFRDNMEGVSASEWFLWLSERIEGRAAAAFVILAGVGLSLLSRRARLSNAPEDWSSVRNILLKRGIFLFGLGLCYGHIWWPADILHFYGIYLTIGAFLLTASDRRLWTLAAGFTGIFVIFMFVCRYEEGWDFENLNDADLSALAGIIRHFFFNGYYPIFPWVAFLLIGIWLGRLNISERALRMKILLGGIVSAFLAEGVSFLLTDFSLTLSYKADTTLIYFLISTIPDPPMPLFMISACGTGLALIIISIIIAEKFAESEWMRPFLATGRLSLTIYLFHVIIGMNALESLGMLDKPESLALVNAILCYGVSVISACFWTARFERGPLEWMMRRISHFSVRSLRFRRSRMV